MKKSRFRSLAAFGSSKRKKKKKKKKKSQGGKNLGLNP